MRRGQKQKPPKTPRGTELYHEDPTTAHELWNAGFRPLPANELKPMMEVVCWTTDVFQLEVDRKVGYIVTLVGDVMDDEMGTITASTLDRGNVECDELAEVWARDGRR